MSTRNPPGTGMLRLSEATPRKNALPITTGCDFAQEFYFSKPLPPEAVTMFLAKEHNS
jgi:EAL domain-containing protein (putative c-di-GMP-specific phosphodiesterase class I)